MVECLRCGRCCHFYEDGILKRCRFLISLPNGKTVCRIYSKRLGTRLGKVAVCALRKDSTYDYEGCPLNTGKPIETNTDYDNRYRHARVR